MNKKSIEDKVKGRINDTYINLDTSNMSLEVQNGIAKYRKELIKQIKNLFMEENISKYMMNECK